MNKEMLWLSILCRMFVLRFARNIPWCTRNATASAARLWRGCWRGRARQAAGWAALLPRLFAINDLTLNTLQFRIQTLQFRIQNWGDRVELLDWIQKSGPAPAGPGPRKRRFIITYYYIVITYYFAIITYYYVIITYYSAIITYYSSIITYYYTIITLKWPDEVNIIAYYSSLLHHYYLLLRALLRIIALLLHHYYFIITYYYGPIITYYYVIILLRISTRSVIGNNRPIITYYGPTDFADVVAGL